MKAPAALALLAILLAFPLAAATEARVDLRPAEGRWNGESAATLDEPAPSVLLFVPASARIQLVEADGAPTTWRAAGGDALEVDLPPGATRARVAYDLAEPTLRATRVIAPQAYDSLTVAVEVPEGRVVRSDDSAFSRDARTFTATLLSPQAGDGVAFRVVGVDEVGELPVLLAVVALSLIVLVLGIAWHQVRPPLAGAEPARFMDHLSELQARLLPPAIAFGLLNLFYFMAGLRAVDLSGFAFVAPTFGTDASLAARAFDALAERLVPPGVELVALRPVEAVLAQVQMALFLALVTVMPLLLYEVGAFIGPALREKERRIARTVLPLVGGLLLVGALFGYLKMAPLMIQTLYAYAPGIGARPLVAVSDLVSFALLIVIAFALAFELPVVMYALSRFGIVSATVFWKYFRHAVVVIVLVAGIVTPDPSVVSQLLVALPVTALYLVGIGAAALGERRRPAQV